MPKFYRAGEHPSEWKVLSDTEVNPVEVNPIEINPVEVQINDNPIPEFPTTTHPIVKILNELPDGIFKYIPGFVGPFYNKYILGCCSDKTNYSTLEEAAEAAQNTNCRGIVRTPKQEKFKLRAGKYKPINWKLSPDSIIILPKNMTEEYSWVRTSGNIGDEEIKPRDVLELKPDKKAKYNQHNYPRKAIVKASRR